MTLRADRCELPSGTIVDPYYVQELQDWIQVVAFDTSNRILVTRQYRHAGGIISTELPCGTIESGETPVAAARRELLEETGCTADELVPLPVFSPNPARFANQIHAFVATGTHPVQRPREDETEVIEFEFLPPSQILALIDAGGFPQALHVASLLLALRKRKMLLIDGQI
jgi:8-oxo-dGTP pyrophosphatase MutT (NUDIX family)